MQRHITSSDALQKLCSNFDHERNSSHSRVGMSLFNVFFALFLTTTLVYMQHMLCNFLLLSAISLLRQASTHFTFNFRTQETLQSALCTRLLFHVREVNQTIMNRYSGSNVTNGLPSRIEWGVGVRSSLERATSDSEELALKNITSY